MNYHFIQMECHILVVNKYHYDKEQWSGRVGKLKGEVFYKICAMKLLQIMYS